MVNAIPLIMAAAATLAACSTKQEAEAQMPNPTAQTRSGDKIVPSPWQPPAEVDPPHKSPGDRVEPEPGKPVAPPTDAPPPKTPS